VPNSEFGINRATISVKRKHDGNSLAELAGDFMLPVNNDAECGIAPRPRSGRTMNNPP
jgi:hypothetical protein